MVSDWKRAGPHVPIGTLLSEQVRSTVGRGVTLSLHRSQTSEQFICRVELVKFVQVLCFCTFCHLFLTLEMCYRLGALTCSRAQRCHNCLLFHVIAEVEMWHTENSSRGLCHFHRMLAMTLYLTSLTGGCCQCGFIFLLDSEVQSIFRLVWASKCAMD